MTRLTDALRGVLAFVSAAVFGAACGLLLAAYLLGVVR